MNRARLLIGTVVGLLALAGMDRLDAMAQTKSVEFGSPAAPPTRMADDGSLLLDWGRFAFTLKGEGLPGEAAFTVVAAKLDGIVPCAVGTTTRGPLAVTATAFRSPTYPGGTDVLTVLLRNSSATAVRADMGLVLPDGARVGRRAVSLGGRIIVALPTPVEVQQTAREWGCDDDSQPLPGWGRPDVECDPAFRNIRAGMNGVPIIYKFSVPAGSASDVVLGFCESHWDVAGQRPVVCSVEGAPAQTLDPLARWGKHKPGAVLFQGKDANNDGRLVVSVLPAVGAPDPNPILNVIWLFPAGSNPNLDQVVRGRMNDLATRCVDVGGEKDQSLYLSGKVEYALTVPPNGSTEICFLLGAAGGSAPMPGRTAWTVETLRKAARDVNRDWKEK
jgi:hypothetical protein